VTNEEFEKRMDRLTERHEALTQTMEHMALQGEEQNKRIEQLIAASKADGENNAALARIAQAHETRLTDLEDGK